MSKLSQFNRMIAFSAGISLGIIAMGCARVQTRYFFASAGLDDKTNSPKLTFYRVTLTGESFGEKSSLQEGFYNADALHQLFGEVSQPKPQSNATTQPGETSTGPQLATANGAAELIYDPGTNSWTLANNSRFTIFYGANADKMAEQVQAMANDKSVANALAGLVGGSIDKPTTQPAKSGSQLASLQKKATAAQKSASDLADQLDEVIQAMDANATPQQGRQALLDSAGDVLKSLGSGAKLNPSADPTKLDAAFGKAEAAYKKLSAQ